MQHVQGLWYLIVFLTVPLSSSSQLEECQRSECVYFLDLLEIEVALVPAGIIEARQTVSPLPYNGIEPDVEPVTGADPTKCLSDGVRYLVCGPGEGVLSDGDIGLTDSVDVSDADQVRRFFVWHRDNGTVGLVFGSGSRGIPLVDSFSQVTYVDVYTLTVPSAKIEPPANTSFSTDLSQTTGTIITPETCVFSSSTTNTLMRSIYTLPTNPDDLIITFSFSPDTDWLFISEILLCSADPPFPISCDTPPLPTDPTTSTPTDSTTSTPTDPTTSTTTASLPPPPPTPHPLTLSSPPPTGATVTPDLRQPDSVSLTCSVASPPTAGYQYQWQWRKNGATLTSDTRLSIRPSDNTQSTSLLISGLRYSDAGDYMCEVEYAVCPDEVDCSGISPVTGNVHLELPGTYKHFQQIQSNLRVAN